MHVNSDRSDRSTQRHRAPAIPDGWFSINPRSAGRQRNNNAHPVTPPDAVRPPLRPSARGPDLLGLAKAIDPLRGLFRDTNRNDNTKSARKRKSATPSTAALSGTPRVLHSPQVAASLADSGARNSPRHVKLQQQQQQHRVEAGRGDDAVTVHAYSPQRLARLPSPETQGRCLLSPHPPAKKETSPIVENTNVVLLSLDVPLHELMQTLDDAVDADPYVDSNQATVTHLFMAQWLQRFDANRSQFKSFAVHAEIGFQELYRLTANLPVPNEFIAAFGYKIFGDLAAQFGPYAPLLRVLCSELYAAAYSLRVSPPLPYFAIVKHQKRLVVALQRDKKHRKARNALVAQEIHNVHHMFRHFLDACSHGIVRTLFREWYSIAIIRKKNSKKYIEYFSAWFTSSVKSLVPKLFAMWKHDTVQRKMAKMQAQLALDGEHLATLQHHIDDLTSQRDLAQLESLALRNDRKQIEDMIQRLNRKIQSAGVYLEGSYRREGIVCQEGQLRVEAASFLPPLVLESLLRGYHSAGFLQQLHHEFISQPVSDVIATASAGSSTSTQHPLSRVRSLSSAFHSMAASKIKSTVLQECLAEIIKLRVMPLPSESNSMQTSFSTTNASSSPPTEISIYDFAKLVCSMEKRIAAKDVYVVFTSAVQQAGANFSVDDDDDDTDELQGETLCDLQKREAAERIADLYEQFLDAIRTQDEHYARHVKLFSSRMLESHEVTVVPSLPVRRTTALVTDEESDSMIVALPSADLGIINGAKRFSIANVCPIKMTAINSNRQHHTRGSPLLKPSGGHNATSAPSNAALDKLAFIKREDFGISTRHTRSFVMIFLSHLASEYGSLLFSPADMSAFCHDAYKVKDDPMQTHGSKGSNAPATPTSATASTTATLTPNSEEPGNDDQGFHNIVTAYEAWNRLAAQMIEAEIVQSRGGFAFNTDAAGTSESAMSDGKPRISNGNVAETWCHGSNGAAHPGIPCIQPKLLYHIEPMPHGVLMTAASKEKEHASNGSSSSNASLHGAATTRVSVSMGETYHTARVRKLSIEDTTKLTECVKRVAKVVEMTSTRLQDFNVVRQQVRDFRHLQWEQASEIASQFTSASCTSGQHPNEPTTAGVFSNSWSQCRDDRKHVFECISFDNSVLERIFSVEDNPNDELERVRALLERKKHLVRHLYTKYRPQIQHAVSLDDLWHVVKVLRFPKDIHMLPAMRDEDMAANGFEQVFTADDLAEILLQLCNEQFLPQITPISARVEYFVNHHLPFAVQNQSILRRELLHHSDVKRVLIDHSQTLRIIFRRYCAKEREPGLIVAAHTASASSSNSHKSSSSHHPHHHAPAHRSRHTTHGITKYMRLVDWLAFIQDYNLLRPRFLLEYAVTVFRNVQEADSGLDDHSLEMIYSEFCEAIVGVAACFFPNPFLKSATKVNQFIQRFLPVSPEEVRDHSSTNGTGK
uniref:Uncharacterized protein n=1 Tax=Globisporangium ultimum (strain ATCC 200006 / CBS 805.95 / DAOM BR144) TaxID=431595 RepID=K3WHQ3_GLOUD